MDTTKPAPRLPAWAADVLAGVVVIATAIVSEMGGGPRPPFGGHPAMQALPLGALLLALAVLPLRRRWSVPALAAGLFLYLMTALFGVPSTAVGIVLVLAAYSVGSRTSRLVTLAAGGLATAAVAILSVTVSEFGVIDPRVFQIAAGVAVAAALGDSSRSRREFVRAATERAERAEQTREAEAQRRVAEERLRIAQDLHDTVAHQISVISLNAGMASSALESSPAQAREALGTIRTASRGVLTEIGSLLRYLRSEDAPGAATTPQHGLGDVDALVGQLSDTGLAVRLTRTGDLDRVSGTVGGVAYRIVQEGLTNAHKHGAGGTADVDLSASDDALTVRITNPVSDVAPNQPRPPRGGLGLTGIRERVAAAAGTVEIDHTTTSFTLLITLPLRSGDHT